MSKRTNYALCAFLAAVIFTFAAITNSPPSSGVTCDGQQMQQSDVCIHENGSSSSQFSYSQQQAYQANAPILWWVLAGVGVVVGIVILAYGRSSSQKEKTSSSRRSVWDEPLRPKLD